MYDAVIIGAGMSGLAAGIRLALFGQRVCIVEQHYTIGGLNSFYRLRGRDYDVGLHALTNFTPKGTKKGPLARLLRQLRIRWEDFGLCEQIGSRISFPGIDLHFNNDIDLLVSEIGRHFPAERDNFQRLLRELLDYDDLSDTTYALSARQVVGSIIRDPLLVEMLLCPLMWYGNAREHDMDFAQFCIMFRSIYLEGFARPLKGVRLILKHLVRKYRSLGGELRLKSPVARIALTDSRATGVVLATGEELQAHNVISSAGYVETMRLCGSANHAADAPGRMSFCECISVLDQEPRKLCFDRTIVFFNDSHTFNWHKPDADLCDVRTGVVCSPNNFQYDDETGKLPDSMIRITAIAAYDLWTSLLEEQYRINKLRWYDAIVASAVRFVPDFRSHVVDTDMFTPRTIHRFTLHINGAVYGAPTKRIDGSTAFPNLFVCGTDQGFLGVIGAIVSGISVANNQLLRL